MGSKNALGVTLPTVCNLDLLPRRQDGAVGLSERRHQQHEAKGGKDPHEQIPGRIPRRWNGKTKDRQTDRITVLVVIASFFPVPAVGQPADGGGRCQRGPGLPQCGPNKQAVGGERAAVRAGRRVGGICTCLPSN